MFPWLAEDLPGYTVINRGIDSFQMSDLLYFADRLVLPTHFDSGDCAGAHIGAQRQTIVGVDVVIDA